MGYFSDKRVLLEAEKNQVNGKLEMLEEVEQDFKKKIEKSILNSKEFDGTGGVWINAFSLLDDLGLEEWNLQRNEKIVSGLDEIKELNDDKRGKNVK